jgi:hypothetical protein
MDDSGPAGASFSYSRDTLLPGQVSAVAALLITQWRDSRPGFEGQPDEHVEVDGTRVYLLRPPSVFEGQEIVRAYWLVDGRTVDIAAFGDDGVSTEDVREETLRIAESMIP